MSRYTRSIHAGQDALKKLHQLGPIGATEDPERVRNEMGRVRDALAQIASYMSDHQRDSDVEPGPEGRAAIITESESGGFRQIVSGPKSTERTEVVS